MKLFLFILAGTSLASAYVRLQDGAVYEHRADSTDIRFYLNTAVAPGLKNADGQTWIASDADITGAVAGAIGAWNSVASANVHFAPVQPTGSLDGTPNLNVIAFDDTPETRMLTAGALAVTVRLLSSPDSTGVFLKTDIIFGPTAVFSTNLAAGTYDLQSVLTHELGHSLGADHSGVLSATMFQGTAPQVSDRSRLSNDDIAFVSAAYPLSNDYGIISGTTTDQNGTLLHGGLVSAQDPVSGAIVGGFSDPTDGTFSFSLPPGSYQLWAEPLTSLVKAADLYLSSIQSVDTAFQPALSPSLVSVTSGSSSHVSLAATAGASPIAFQFAGAVPQNASETFQIYAGPAAIPSAANVAFVIQASGLGPDFSDTDISLVGPASVVPGSVVSLGKSQYEITLNVPAALTKTSASMIISYKGNTASFSGGLVIEPVAPSFPAAGVGNVFSYASQSIAPGEIIAIFGSHLGPAVGVIGDYDASGTLATNVSGITVTFNGLLAPIFYASSGQLNVEVPFEVAGSASADIVISNDGTSSPKNALPVSPSVPGLFSAAINPDYSMNTASNPIRRGQYATLYCVGLGETGAVQTGRQVTDASPAEASVTVTIDGQPYTPSYAGAAPGFTGLDQINIQIPDGVTAGKVSLSIAINGQQSQAIPIWIQ